MAYQKQHWSDDPADNTPLSAARLNHMEDGIANIETDLTIEDGSIGTAQIANSAVTGPKLANNAVSSAKIADLSVTTGKIAGDAVTATKIANSAVGNANIQNGAVSSAKIGSGAVQNIHIATNAVSGTELASNAVSSTHINTGAVTSTKIGNNAITNVKIVNETIQGWEKLAPNSVPGSRFLDDSVTIDKFHPGIKPDSSGARTPSSSTLGTSSITVAELSGLKSGTWIIMMDARYHWPGHASAQMSFSLTTSGNSTLSSDGFTAITYISGADEHNGVVNSAFRIAAPSNGIVRLRANVNHGSVFPQVTSRSGLVAMFVRG